MNSHFSDQSEHLYRSIFYTLVFIACWSNPAFSFNNPIVYIQTYASPDGDKSYTVDPSERYGRGESLVEFHEGEQLVWKKTLPFTLQNCQVTPDGSLVGYGYTKSLKGDRPTAGDLVIAIIDRDGLIAFEHRLVREFLNKGDASPRPYVRELNMSRDGNYVAFHLAENKDQKLLLLDIKESEILFSKSMTILLDTKRVSIPSLAFIDPHPLMMIRWESRDSIAKKSLLHHTILDIEGNILWSRDNIETAGMVWHDLISLGGGEIAFYDGENNGQKVSCTLSDGEWNFNLTDFEIERKKPVQSIKPKQELVIPTLIEAENIKTINLDIEYEDFSDQRIGRLHTFDYNGDLFTIEQVEEEVYQITKRGIYGEIIDSHSIQIDGLWRPRDLFPLPDSKLLLDFDETYPTTGPPVQRMLPLAPPFRLFIFDLRNESLSEIELADPRRTGNTMVNSNGLIMINVDKDEGPTMMKQRDIINQSGKILGSLSSWTLSKKFDEFDHGIVCLTSNDEIAYIPRHGSELSFLDFEGNIIRTIDLEEALGYLPLSIGQLWPDSEGGVFIGDSMGIFPIIQISKNGEILKKFNEIGRPDILGRLWVARKGRLNEIDLSGNIIRTIGPQPDSNKLNQPRSFFVDENGYSYILSNDTKKIFVFDQNGDLYFKSRPHEHSIAEIDSFSSPEILIFPDYMIDLNIKRIHRGSPLRSNTQFYRYRIGKRPNIDLGYPNYFTTEKYIRTALHTIVYEGHLFCLRNQELRALDLNKDSVVGKTKKDASRVWIENLSQPLISPQGNLLAYNTTPKGNMHLAGYSVYDRTAQPIRTQSIPDSIKLSRMRSAWDDDLIYTLHEGDLIVIDDEGEIRGKLDIDQEIIAQTEWIALTKHGKELWLYDGRTGITCLDVSKISSSLPANH